MEIELEDGKVKIIAKAAFFTQTMVFPINEPYEQEYEGVKMKVSYQNKIAHNYYC